MDFYMKKREKHYILSESQTTNINSYNERYFRKLSVGGLWEITEHQGLENLSLWQQLNEIYPVT